MVVWRGLPVELYLLWLSFRIQYERRKAHYYRGTRDSKKLRACLSEGSRLAWRRVGISAWGFTRQAGVFYKIMTEGKPPFPPPYISNA